MPRETLIHNINQHQAKNKYSKSDDLNIDLAMNQTKQYLEKRFIEERIPNFIDENYYFEIEKYIEISFMISNIKSTKIRAEFDTAFIQNKIKPDGGVLFLRKKDNSSYKKFYSLLKLNTKAQMTYAKSKIKTSNRKCDRKTR